ncbi:DedA family protein [Aeromonas cavernicola]|uniref:VTT domain-containing protein n=1 Tax=Aeromonas cavernicola TaxID=1006623 RepID=A0A2H9U8Q1_9GAMM|nr:DedA family protein [Aeromonas cavernicola]PJG60359.1 hypothetical protein CUC53_02315 [Aeromonas cavernicola]
MDLILFVIDFILHVDVHLRELFENYGVWVYAILFLIIFCETGLVVTPFLPGDSLLFAAGALTVGSVLDVHTLVGLLIIAAVLGNVVNYTIGHFFGERLFRNPDSKIFRRDYLDKTHGFYAKHGGKTIIITRFLPIVRTFAPFVAGMGAMTYPRFLAFNLVGAVLWVVSFVYAGHFFGNLPVFRQNFTLLIFGIIGISVLPMLIGVAKAKMSSRSSD